MAILTNRRRRADIRHYRILNTGALGDSLDVTISPAMQVFLNGRSILNYSADDDGTTPRDLAAPMKRVFLAGHACDPTK